MKRVCWVLLIALASLPFAAAQEAAPNQSELPNFEWGLGLGPPNIAFQVEQNEQGRIVSVRGINLALGYSAKHYFDPVEYEEFNPFWHWGTVALIIPYIGVGVDYVFDSGFYIGGGTIYLAPYLSIGVYLD